MDQWAICIVAAAVIIVVAEARKFVRRRARSTEVETAGAPPVPASRVMRASAPATVPMSVIIPRWEFRTFGTHFGAAEEAFAAMTPGAVQETDELYLLSGRAMARRPTSSRSGST